MKKGVMLIFFLLFIAGVFSFVSALEGTDSEKIDAGYACLQNKVNQSASLSLGEATFAMLALGSERGKLTNVITSEKKSDEACWPKGGCNLKETAQVLLAYDRAGLDTDAVESWLSSKRKTAKLDLTWYLEIDIQNHVPSECTIYYDNNEYSVNVNEDMTLDSDAGACLKRRAGNYWLTIQENCLDKEFEVSCSEGFITTLLYEKKTGGTIFVSSETHGAIRGGFTSEEVKAECFSTSSNGACDYEGSLWATMALQKPGRDISKLIAYLTALAEDNKKYFPDAFLYSMIDGNEHYGEIIRSQKGGNRWDLAGSPYSEFYDTSLALMALSDRAPSETNSAKARLLIVQGNDGCWNGGNLADTSLVLYSAWPRRIPLEGPAPPTPPTCQENWSCSDFGACVNGVQTKTCTDLGGCNTTTDRPPLTQSCTPGQCFTDWDCPVWYEIACVNGQKTRTCTDFGGCNTTLNKPAENITCSTSCIEDWDCGSGFGACVNGTQSQTCVDKNTCGSTFNKPNATRVCAECSAGTECSDGKVCDVSKSVCVECLSNSQCAVGNSTKRICEPATHTCVGCLNDSQCSSNEVCNPTTKSCQPECSSDNDCTGGFVCQNSTGLCVECKTDLNCPLNEVCKTSTNLCVECTSNNDCDAGEVCNLNTNTCSASAVNATTTGSRFCEDNGKHCEGATAC
ncbi:MAG: hypothetical protein AABX86_02745, partial [Nanoarchaeota archaeon]